MKPIVINKYGEMIKPTDWKAKSEKIIEELDNTIFADMTKADSYDYKVDKDGNIIKTKKRVRKGDIMPEISPAQVSAKLNRLLRIYRPMNITEARALDDTDYLEAYGYFLDVISHINEYCTFLPDKQLYSAFCNISTDVYNELLGDPNYSQVFASIEDGFVQSNFSVAQAGLVDTKTTITKLQTKDAGHNLVRNPEAITLVQNNHFDRQELDMRLAKFNSIVENSARNQSNSITKKLPKGDK